MIGEPDYPIKEIMNTSGKSLLKGLGVCFILFQVIVNTFPGTFVIYLLSGDIQLALCTLVKKIFLHIKKQKFALLCLVSFFSFSRVLSRVFGQKCLTFLGLYYFNALYGSWVEWMDQHRKLTACWKIQTTSVLLISKVWLIGSMV